VCNILVQQKLPEIIRGLGAGDEVVITDGERTANLLDLPFHHRDPFDRLLIAQSMAEGIPLVSADATFDAYPIRRMW